MPTTPRRRDRWLTTSQTRARNSGVPALFGPSHRAAPSFEHSRGHASPRPLGPCRPGPVPCPDAPGSCSAGTVQASRKASRAAGQSPSCWRLSPCPRRRRQTAVPPPSPVETTARPHHAGPYGRGVCPGSSGTAACPARGGLRGEGCFRPCHVLLSHQETPHQKVALGAAGVQLHDSFGNRHRQVEPFLGEEAFSAQEQRRGARFQVHHLLEVRVGPRRAHSARRPAHDAVLRAGVAAAMELFSQERVRDPHFGAPVVDRRRCSMLSSWRPSPRRARPRPRCARGSLGSLASTRLNSASAS